MNNRIKSLQDSVDGTLGQIREAIPDLDAKLLAHDLGVLINMINDLTKLTVHNYECAPPQPLVITTPFLNPSDNHKIIPSEHMGEVSDGYHTFNELYDHRAKLFSVICELYKDNAWKSRLHEDGTMYPGMFIVGIMTPRGPATYHYNIDPYWCLFNIQEFNRAIKWDGHTSDEAIDRILSLKRVAVCKVIEKQASR